MSSTIAGLRNNSVSEIHHIDSRDTTYASRERLPATISCSSVVSVILVEEKNELAESCGILGVAWVLVSASDAPVGRGFPRASHTSHPRNGDP